MNQFVLTNKSAVVIDQVLQYFKRLWAQFYLFLTVLEASTCQVELEPIKTMYFVSALLHGISDRLLSVESDQSLWQG